MAEAEIVRGGVSTGREPWKMCNSFAGYSLICARTKQKKVVDALQYEFNCRHPNVNTKHWTAFSGFVFVRPESSMTVNAFDSWRWRNGLRHLDLILHKSADTATEGLLSNLQAQNRSRRLPWCPQTGLRPVVQLPVWALPRIDRVHRESNS